MTLFAIESTGLGSATGLALPPLRRWWLDRLGEQCSEFVETILAISPLRAKTL
jgi:hypothetical protein